MSKLSSVLAVAACSLATAFLAQSVVLHGHEASMLVYP